MKPSDIKTTHTYADWKCAEITLPDGRVYLVRGSRYRTGTRGRRSYAWSFTLHGPGLAHVERSDLRELHWCGLSHLPGPHHVSLNKVQSYCSTLTEAKKRLIRLIERLDA